MLLIALSALPLLVMLFYRYPMLLLCLYPVVITFNVYYPFYPFVVSGYWLLPMDFVYFFTVLHLLICSVRSPKKVVRTLTDNIYLTVFLTLVALSVVVYTPVYGQSAIGEARKL